MYAAWSQEGAHNIQLLWISYDASPSSEPFILRGEAEIRIRRGWCFPPRLSGISKLGCISQPVVNVPAEHSLLVIFQTPTKVYIDSLTFHPHLMAWMSDLH